ncbi:hypothetical protein N7532_000906 [Penicillium argentinense]|uniref:Uncharacterized protein n=1 Tax=Penicillium argentinense TaxID=1131581 RepID=A0A9W9KLQ8_9EURO|nr:uncharacterized protein N7532_000906 [Penicillium argentinense]KAJ5110371.1 hypothetical protein N7532_000906 [Penicillium argentinense]
MVRVMITQWTYVLRHATREMCGIIGILDLPADHLHPILIRLDFPAGSPGPGKPTTPHLMRIIISPLRACPTPMHPLLDLTDQKRFVVESGSGRTVMPLRDVGALNVLLSELVSDVRRDGSGCGGGDGCGLDPGGRG